MIARIWTGDVLIEKSNDFLNYMLNTGVNDCTLAEGNQGVLILKESNDISTKYTFISFWQSKDFITKFFKSDSDVAFLYPEDKIFLSSMSERVKFLEAFLYPCPKTDKYSNDIFQLPPHVII